MLQSVISHTETIYIAGVACFRDSLEGKTPMIGAGDKRDDFEEQPLPYHRKSGASNDHRDLSPASPLDGTTTRQQRWTGPNRAAAVGCSTRTGHRGMRCRRWTPSTPRKGAGPAKGGTSTSRTTSRSRAATSGFAWRPRAHRRRPGRG